jgi:hypothetical protein
VAQQHGKGGGRESAGRIQEYVERDALSGIVDEKDGFGRECAEPGVFSDARVISIRRVSTRSTRSRLAITVNESLVEYWEGVARTARGSHLFPTASTRRPVVPAHGPPGDSAGAGTRGLHRYGPLDGVSCPRAACDVAHTVEAANLFVVVGILWRYASQSDRLAVQFTPPDAWWMCRKATNISGLRI